MAELDERALATARLWAEYCRGNDLWVSPDSRVGLQVAARLAGMSYGGLRNAISAGRGPATYKIGGGGHQRTVRLLDLAEWLERKRND